MVTMGRHARDEAQPAAVAGEGAVVVSIESVHKVFSDSQVALRSIDLDIAKGEFVTILGPSGCGKTTLLRILAGLEQATSGRVLLDGVDIVDVPTNKRPMSMVFQSYALFPHLSVFDNIAYGLRASGIGRSEAADRVGVVLSIMDLVGLEDRYPGQLSGGQQQRVALARSVVVRPQLLLLDEPLSSLDARLREQMRSELRRIQRQLGITSVYVTHDQAEAMALSDRIVVMSDGKIEQVGTPEQIYREPVSLFVADFIGKANVFQAPVVRREAEMLRVEIFGVEVSIDDPGGIGEEATVVVRPEDFEVVAFSRPNDYHPRRVAGFVEAPGWLRSVEYFGSSSHLAVELFDGSLIAIVENHTAGKGPSRLPSPGDGVLIRVPATCLRVVKATT